MKPMVAPKGSSVKVVRDTALGFCAGYQVYTKFLESVVGVFQTLPRVGWLVSTISGPAMMDARRDVVKGFLGDTPARYLMMVDSDIHFYPADVSDLWEHLEKDPSVGAVSGLYVDSNGYPVAGEFKPDGGYLPLKTPPTEVTQVDVTGAGFLMIKREVLESPAFSSVLGPGGAAFDHILYPSGKPDGVYGSKVLGEDVSFCKRLKDNGWKLLLDPDVFLGHLKVRRLYPDGRSLP